MEEQIVGQSDNQSSNSKPWLWKKGQSGNPKGRPKGKTLKEYVREYLACMTDEEREEFMDGLPKELLWKMAEGNPQNEDKLDVTSGGEKIGTIPEEAIAIIEADLKKKKIDEV